MHLKDGVTVVGEGKQISSIHWFILQIATKARDEPSKTMNQELFVVYHVGTGT